MESGDVANAKDVRQAWQRFLILMLVDADFAKEEMRKYLRSKSKKEIKEGFSEVHSGVLKWGIDYLGLPTEDYEICQALNELIEERK